LQLMELQKRIGYFLGPGLFLILLFNPFGMDPLKSKMLAVAAWMLSWWILEVVPIYITAMLPMVFFPALGIMDVKATFVPYANPIIFLFLGGFIIALAMEERRLHERIAFGLIRITGTRPKQIILGFMLATASVAMWISNTATAVMMLPIAISILAILDEKGAPEAFKKRFSLLLMLGIAYAANIGGTMTLIGTPPNLVFAGYFFERFGLDFGFAEWMMIGIPIGSILLVSGFILLTRIIYPISADEIEGVKELFQSKWQSLGTIGKAEKRVLAVFSLTVIAWILVNPINAWVGERILNNTNVAMSGGLLMFLVPVKWKQGEFILHWKSTTKLPWGILILFGGGLSLANGLDQAGIIGDIANWVSSSVTTNALILMLGLVALSLFLTEIMSNVALVTVLLPVIFEIAKGTGTDPLLLTIPVTLAASCAFMMPISTPPNAIVYSSGHISVRQMMKAGIWMNLIAIVIIVLLSWVLL